MLSDYLNKKRKSLYVLAITFILMPTLSWGKFEKNQCHKKHRITQVIRSYPSQNRSFVGREQELCEVKHKLETLQNSVIALIGSAGIGKSQIARQFANIHACEYEIVWWIDAGKDIVPQIKQLLYGLNSKLLEEFGVFDLSSKNSHELLEITENILSHKLSNWLLVFDNIQNIPDEIRNILKIAGSKSKKHIILTTKNKLIWRDVINIKVLQRKESILLLSSKLPNVSKEEFVKLAIALDDYPLAIVHAGNYINHNPIKITEYVELYEKEKARLWSYEENFINNNKDNFEEEYQYTLPAIVGLNIWDIKQHSQAAYKLLLFLSGFYNDNIPEAIIRKFFNNDILEMGKVLTILLRHSVLDIKMVDNLKGNTYHIHDVVRQVLKNMMTAEEKKQSIEAAILSLKETIPPQIDKSFSLFFLEPYYLLQVKELFNAAESLNIVNNDLITLKIRYLEYNLSGKRDYTYAEEIIKDIKKLLKTNLNVSKMNLVRFGIMQGAYLTWKKENYQKSIDKLESTLLLLKDESIQFYREEFVMIYNWLAQDYHLIGEIDTALTYSNLAKKIVENHDGFLGNKDAFYAARAKILVEKGEFDEALNMINKASYFVKEFSDIKDAISFVPVNLLKSEILLKIGKYKEAYNLAIELKNAIKNIFQGKKHKFVAIVHIVLASAANGLNKASYAEENIQQGLKLLKEIYGNDQTSRHSAMAHAVLGDIYTNLGRYQEANREYLLSEQIYNNVLRNHGINDISELYIKLIDNSINLKSSLDAMHYFDLHKKTFGNSHTNTIKITKTLVEKGLLGGKAS